MYIYTRICIYIRMCICMWMHVCIRKCRCTVVHVHICITHSLAVNFFWKYFEVRLCERLQVLMRICTHVCRRVRIYISIYIYTKVCMYWCVYVYKRIHYIRKCFKVAMLWVNIYLYKYMHMSQHLSIQIYTSHSAMLQSQLAMLWVNIYLYKYMHMSQHLIQIYTWHSEMFQSCDAEWEHLFIQIYAHESTSVYTNINITFGNVAKSNCDVECKLHIYV